MNRTGRPCRTCRGTGQTRTREPGRPAVDDCLDCQGTGWAVAPR